MKDRTVGRRTDGSVWISLGDPRTGPHWQGDFPAPMNEAVLWQMAPSMAGVLEKLVGGDWEECPESNETLIPTSILFEARRVLAALKGEPE